MYDYKCVKKSKSVIKIGDFGSEGKGACTWFSIEVGARTGVGGGGNGWTVGSSLYCISVSNVFFINKICFHVFSKEPLFHCFFQVGLVKAQHLFNPLFRHTLWSKGVKGVISHGVLEVMTVARASLAIGWEVTSGREGSTTSTWGPRWAVSCWTTPSIQASPNVSLP